MVSPRLGIRNLVVGVLTLAVGFAGALGTAQAPSVLIGQTCETGGYPKHNLMDPFAEHFAEIGILSPITFSLLDQNFRRATMDGKASAPQKQPTVVEVMAAAKTMGITYVVWIEEREVKIEAPEKGSAIQSNGTAIGAKAFLYKNGKQVWKDDMVQAMSVGPVDMLEQTLKSLTSSLCGKMRDAALRDLVAFTAAETQKPATGAGQAPLIAEGRDTDPVLNDWVAIQLRVKELLALRKPVQAEMLLRDAVDAAPQDINRRKALIEFLRSQGNVASALKVIAETANALGAVDMAAEAAMMLMVDGKFDAANTMVNDALSAGSEDPAIRLVAAELRMREAHPDLALKHLEEALKKTPTAELHLMRALCRALLGAEDGTKLDTAAAAKLDPTSFYKGYRRLATIFDSAMKVEGPDLRALFQKVILKPKSEEVADELDSHARAATACIAFLGEDAPNPIHQKSHGARLLALNLLLQLISELRQYAGSIDENLLSEARIDLGESLKQFESARIEFANETKNAGLAETYR